LRLAVLSREAAAVTGVGNAILQSAWSIVTIAIVNFIGTGVGDHVGGAVGTVADVASNVRAMQPAPSRAILICRRPRRLASSAAPDIQATAAAALAKRVAVDITPQVEQAADDVANAAWWALLGLV
jgi:hypothetical protein